MGKILPYSGKICKTDELKDGNPRSCKNEETLQMTVHAQGEMILDPDRPPTMHHVSCGVHSFWVLFGPSTLGTACCSSGKSVKLTGFS